MKNQNCVTQIQIVSLYKYKQMTFLRILQKMLKIDLILQIMNQINHWKRIKGKNKKVIGLMKDELGNYIRIKFVGFGAKTYSYLIDDCSEDKKAKD